MTARSKNAMYYDAALRHLLRSMPADADPPSEPKDVAESGGSAAKPSSDGRSAAVWTLGRLKVLVAVDGHGYAVTDAAQERYAVWPVAKVEYQHQQAHEVITAAEAAQWWLYQAVHPARPDLLLGTGGKLREAPRETLFLILRSGNN